MRRTHDQHMFPKHTFTFILLFDFLLRGFSHSLTFTEALQTQAPQTLFDVAPTTPSRSDSVRNESSPKYEDTSGSEGEDEVSDVVLYPHFLICPCPRNSIPLQIDGIFAFIMCFVQCGPIMSHLPLTYLLKYGAAKSPRRKTDIRRKGISTPYTLNHPLKHILNSTLGILTCYFR